MNYYFPVGMRVERWDKPNLRLMFNIPLSATREENLSEGSGWYVNGMSAARGRDAPPGGEGPLVGETWDSEAPWRAFHAPGGSQGKGPGERLKLTI